MSLYLQHILYKTGASLVKSAKLIIATGCLSTISLSATASSLIASTEYLEYELPTAVQERCYEKNNCPEIDVKYLKTNQQWIDSVVNARINNIVINSQPSENPVNNSTSAADAILAINDFAQSQFAEIPNNSSWSYHLMVAPNYLGHVQLGQQEDFELVELSSYVFTGGAHGMSFSEYLIFDPFNKKQVNLSDMIQTGQQARFTALVYDAYKDWVSTVADDNSEYEKSWPFSLSDNVTLTDKGINLRYQYYAIGPYAYGMPVLSIAYAKLEGVIKPRFLPVSTF